jgi:hypothetical protein
VEVFYNDENAYGNSVHVQKNKHVRMFLLCSFQLIQHHICLLQRTSTKKRSLHPKRMYFSVLLNAGFL